MGTEVIVALIGAGALFGSSALAVAVKRFDDRNTKQHDENKALLGEIKGDVKAVGADVTAVKVDVARIVQHNVDQDRRLDQLEQS